MIITDIKTCGTTTFVYDMSTGENIPWHRHSTLHGHVVIRGRTLVEVDREPPMEMKPGMPNKAFQPNVWHQITALDADTIFVNISYTDPPAVTEVRAT